MSIQRNVLAMQGAHKRSVMYEQQLGQPSENMSLATVLYQYLRAFTVAVDWWPANHDARRPLADTCAELGRIYNTYWYACLYLLQKHFFVLYSLGPEMYSAVGCRPKHHRSCQFETIVLCLFIGEHTCRIVSMPFHSLWCIRCVDVRTFILFYLYSILNSHVLCG